MVMHKRCTPIPHSVSPSPSLPAHLQGGDHHLGDLHGHVLLGLRGGGAQVGRADDVRAADQRVALRRRLHRKHIQRRLQHHT